MNSLLLTMILLVLAAQLIVLYKIYVQNEGELKVLRKILRLQLNPRTRMSTIQVQSGPVTEEQEARRVGRATAGKRIVVGGDPESEQHQTLSRQYQGGEEDE